MAWMSKPSSMATAMHSAIGMATFLINPSRLERQPDVILRHAGLGRAGFEQLFELGLLHALPNASSGKAMQLPGHPPREPLGAPDALAGARRVVIERRARIVSLR